MRESKYHIGKGHSVLYPSPSPTPLQHHQKHVYIHFLISKQAGITDSTTHFQAREERLGNFIDLSEVAPLQG